MARIDKATIDKIHDATNIVDVVSDFVSLKKRGSSYLGLCPFHNERTPSFSVSASRGIFKCFSCGKAGSAVSFLMDLEGMSYVEALKWLGRKYGIEVKERELTDSERAAEIERESLFAANEFALKHFEDNLINTEEGRAVGLSYFKERGISDSMVERFHLGYALENPDTLLKAAHAAGFEDKFLIETGLEVRRDNGSLYDRFKGRVIFPVYTPGGRVVAFGGRTLRKEKTIAKYVNSPESSIYSKSNELYGIYQARNAIAKKKNCILVEGYMDVISMHQAGVENVVASSGTSLTDGQIALIRRFADTVTLIYDSDAAGIKAALRGIDMLVGAGFAVKLVLLPEGEDPDSFAQNNSSSEVEQYIEEHSQDIIGFKTDILLAEATDPRSRSEAINSILRTIALIPDIVEQSLYLEELSNKTSVALPTLSASLRSFVAQNLEKTEQKRAQEIARRSIESVVNKPDENNNLLTPKTGSEEKKAGDTDHDLSSIYRSEEEIMRIVLRRGLMYLCDVYPDESSTEPVAMSVVDYIQCELEHDGIEFRDPLLREIWLMALEIRDNRFDDDLKQFEVRLNEDIEILREKGLEEIRRKGGTQNEILKKEKNLQEQIQKEYNDRIDEFSAGYIRDRLLRSDSRRITDMVARLTADRIVLSKMYPKVDAREECLKQLPVAINTLRSAILKDELKDIQLRLKENLPSDQANELMKLYLLKKEMSMKLDKFTGEIVILPDAN